MKAVSPLIVWERDMRATTHAWASFSWFATDPTLPAAGNISVPSSSSASRISEEVELAARKLLGTRKALVFADGTRPPLPAPGREYWDHPPRERLQFWAAAHCRLRIEIEAHRVELTAAIRRHGWEFARSISTNRLHRLDCPTIAPHLWRDLTPQILNGARTEAEQRGSAGYLLGVADLDVAAVTRSAMTHTEPPRLLTRDEAEGLTHRRLCRICQPNLTGSVLRNTRAVKIATMTDRVLGREAFSSEGAHLGTVARLDRSSSCNPDHSVTVSMTITFEDGTNITMTGDEMLAIAVRSQTRS